MELELQKELIKRYNSKTDGLEQCFGQQYGKYACCKMCKHKSNCDLVFEGIKQVELEREQELKGNYKLTVAQINDIVNKVSDFVRKLLEENSNVDTK